MCKQNFANKAQPQRGHQFDGSLNIYYADNRFYDAETGTWLSPDPIKDGLNWYTYCENNPVTNVDPTGLWAQMSAVSMQQRYKDPIAAFISTYSRKPVSHEAFLEMAKKYGYVYDENLYMKIVVPANSAAQTFFSSSDPNYRPTVEHVARIIFHEEGFREGQKAMAWVIANRWFMRAKDTESVIELLQMPHQFEVYQDGIAARNPIKYQEDANNMYYAPFGPNGESMQPSIDHSIKLGEYIDFVSTVPDVSLEQRRALFETLVPNPFGTTNADARDILFWGSSLADGKNETAAYIKSGFRTAPVYTVSDASLHVFSKEEMKWNIKSRLVAIGKEQRHFGNGDD